MSSWLAQILPYVEQDNLWTITQAAYKQWPRARGEKRQVVLIDKKPEAQARTCISVANGQTCIKLIFMKGSFFRGASVCAR
jgi:hypothetical protein